MFNKNQLYISALQKFHQNCTKIYKLHCCSSAEKNSIMQEDHAHAHVSKLSIIVASCYNVGGWKVDIVRFIPPYIHVLNMNYLYIIPFVCAVQTAEHNSAHLKWKIKSCQTIASNLLLHTMQWQFIATKKSPLSDSSLHSFQSPYTASLFQRRKYIFIDLLSTVEELPLWKALRT